jgi:hypothetical protein
MRNRGMRNDEARMTKEAKFLHSDFDIWHFPSLRSLCLCGEKSGRRRCRSPCMEGVWSRLSVVERRLRRPHSAAE